ncbi:MAG: STAS domain-containing protein [Nitrospirales bacterium]
MVVSEERVNEQIIIEKYVGSFDQHARQDFKWRMDVAVNDGLRFVILNMTEVSFIDSAALGWLVLSQRRFLRIGGKLCIVAYQGFVRDILELTEISEWIPIFLSDADALSFIHGVSTGLEEAQATQMQQ